MLVVDAQIHLFDPAAVDRAARIGQLVLSAAEVLADMNAAGVERAYLVPVGTRANTTCLDAARQWPQRFRVMGVPGLNRPEARDSVPEWKAQGYTGARLSFPPFRDPSWLDDGTADWFWPLAERIDLPVMIWAPGRTAAIADVAAAHPDLRLAVDHLNLFVTDKGAEAVGQVVKQLLPLAAYPNVAVKASALPAHSEQPFPHRDLHRPVREVIDAFGARRVFWGTDLTRLNCPMRDAVRMFTDGLDFLDKADLELVMGRAILDWMGW